MQRRHVFASMAAFWLLTAGVTGASPVQTPSFGFLPRGTEIPELGTASARHYSNGDGSIRAIIEASGGPGSTDNVIVPVATGYSGFIKSPFFNFRYTEAQMAVGDWPGNEEERAFAEWDITSIPDGSTIQGVRCSSYCFPTASVPPTRVLLQDISNRPSTVPVTWDGNFALFNDIRNNNTYAYYENPVPPGWLAVELGSQACADLQGRLTANWFAVGYDHYYSGAAPRWEIYFEGYNQGNRPHLIVDYIPAGAPGKPSPQSPPNGGTVTVFRPTLQVALISGADLYNFRVYQGTTELKNVTVSISSWTLDEDLVHGSSYTWDCRAHNSTDWGPFSDRWSFTVSIPLPPAPSPSSPATGASISTLTPTLVVNAVSGADQYWFRVYEQGGPLVQENTNAGVSWALSTLLENGKTYLWDCAAHNIAGWGPWFTLQRSFTVRLTPEPEAPLNGADVDTVQPVLWAKDYGPLATEYCFRIYQGATRVDSGNSSTRDRRVAVNLANMTTHTWDCRVRVTGGWSSYFSPRCSLFVKDFPHAPTCSVPDDGATVTSFKPTLGAKTQAGATYYRFEIYKNGVGSPVVCSSTTRTAIPPVELENLTDYEWQCQIRNAAGLGPFSPRRTFRLEATLPAQPTQELPGAGATVTTYRPLLRVYAINDARRYNFRLSRKTPRELVRDTTITGSRSYSLNFDLLNATTYVWDCRVENALGWGDFCPEREFTVSVAPATPVASSPGNNSDVATFTPTLTVGAIGDAEEYSFRVYQGAARICSLNTTSNSLVTPALVNGTIYSWDCAARNVARWGGYFSPRWNFTVRVLPATPVHESPGNGGSVNTANPTLSVFEVPYADRYEFRVWHGPDLVAQTTDAGRSWMVEPGLVGGLSYEWECRAHNAAGSSGYSARWAFTVAAVPTPPAPVSPQHGEQVADLTPDLTVSPVTAALRYHFQVFDAEIDELVTEGYSSTVTWTVDPGLENGVEYWWHCRAENLYGWGAYFNPRRSFTTRLLPQAPAPSLPPAGATLYTQTPELVVEPVPDALEYHFQVYDDEADWLVCEGTCSTNSWTVSQTLTPGTTYWWQCRARNASDWGEFFSPRRSFTVYGGPGWPRCWSQARPMPLASGGKEVKDGGWLAVGTSPTGQPLVWVAKGNKTSDYYRYDAGGDSWSQLRAIPFEEGTKQKPPRKGCVGVSDGGEHVYMTKGNNTLGFWRYHVQGDTWHRLPDVLEGASGKKVKGGTDMVYLTGAGDSGWVYLLKGHKTEFYRFNVKARRWDTLPSVPYSDRPKYDQGSFLVYDGVGKIYCHQGKYANYLRHAMFRFDVASGRWDPGTLRGMPLASIHGTNKKAKDGAAGAWYDGCLFALKGGNTQEFHRYHPAGDSWHELDTMPAVGATGKRKVKAGGDLVSYGYGTFLALKGNKTLELWRYVVPTLQASSLKPQAEGAQAQAQAQAANLRIAPNPMASGFATVRFSLPKAGQATVTVFDIAGRTVLRQLTIGNRQSTMSLDLRKVQAGVYLVRVDAEGFAATDKLVVQRQ